jgi:hypothetical protein
VLVVVPFGRPKRGARVLLADDQEVVEEFAADSADETLGYRVRPRCPHRCADDPVRLIAAKRGVEGCGERRIAVAGSGTGSPD